MRLLIFIGIITALQILPATADLVRELEQSGYVVIEKKRTWFGRQVVILSNDVEVQEIVFERNSGSVLSIRSYRDDSKNETNEIRDRPTKDKKGNKGAKGSGGGSGS